MARAKFDGAACWEHLCNRPMSTRPLDFAEVNFFVDKAVEIVVKGSPPPPAAGGGGGAGGTREVLFGTVRYVGYTKLSSGLWVGLELPHPTGATNGKVEDVVYFRCKPNHGRFIKLSSIQSCQECPRSMLRKEAEDFRAFQHSQQLPPPPRKVIEDAENLVNQTVFVERSNGARDKGIVRFHGHTAFADGEWVGVELYEPTGRNDGSVAGVPYFSCQPGFGVFVKKESISTRMEEKTEFKKTTPLPTLLAVHASPSQRPGGGGGPGSAPLRIDELDDGNSDPNSPHARPAFALNQTPPPVVDDQRGVPVINNPFGPAQPRPQRNQVVDGDALTPIINRGQNGENEVPSHTANGAHAGLSPADRKEIVRALDRKVQAQVQSKSEEQIARLAETNRRLQLGVIEDAAEHFSGKMRDFLQSSTRKVRQAAKAVASAAAASAETQKAKKKKRRGGRRKGKGKEQRGRRGRHLSDSSSGSSSGSSRSNSSASNSDENSSNELSDDENYRQKSRKPAAKKAKRKNRGKGNSGDGEYQTPNSQQAGVPPAAPQQTYAQSVPPPLPHQHQQQHPHQAGFAPASYLSQGHGSSGSLLGSVVALQQHPAVQQQIQALSNVDDGVLKQKVKEHGGRVLSELQLRLRDVVERSRQRQQDQLRQLKFSFQSKLAAQLRDFEQQIVRRDLAQQKAEAAAAKEVANLRKSLHAIEDKAAAQARALAQTSDARVHDAEQELAAKTMEFERKLASQKAAGEAKLRKVLENVQRVKETTRAQQASQQKMLVEAQNALTRRLEEQEEEHRQELQEMKKEYVIVVVAAVKIQCECVRSGI